MDKYGLPAHAKMVFKGILFEVWQWTEKMYDGSTDTFECIVWDDSATIIPTLGDKILIEDQEQPDWVARQISLPGGRCNRGEDPLVCAKRELLEETGYASNEWELLKEQKPWGKFRRSEYLYVARNCFYKESPHLDRGEKITARPVSFEDFLALGDNPSFFSREVVPLLIRARYNGDAKEDLRRRVFGGQSAI